MADNTLRCPDSDPKRRVGQPPAKSGPGAALHLALGAFQRSLPSRFRKPANELTQRIVDGITIPRAKAADSENPWFHGLALEETWAIAEGLRRALIHVDGEPSEEVEAIDLAVWEDVHRILDRELLAAADAHIRDQELGSRRILEDVSHDLRSPLNSILFLADALRAEHGGPLNPVQSRQMNVLYSATVTLVRLVNDLIDFARLGTREHITVAKAPFSMEPLLADVSNLAGPLTSHRNVTLSTKVGTDGPRFGDQHLLSRVLLNLIFNAIQAVDEGGSVSVEVSDSHTGDLMIEIRDSRVGTDIEQLRRVVSDAEAGLLPGETRGWTRGLGLTVCTRLVMAAGGRIVVTGESGGGAVFQVDLPFEAF